MPELARLDNVSSQFVFIIALAIPCKSTECHFEHRKYVI
jgi:hypothetical protein